MLSAVNPGLGFGFGYGFGPLQGSDELNGYGYDLGGPDTGSGSDTGSGFVPDQFKYRVVINTAQMSVGNYTAKFVLNTENPSKPTFESASVSFAVTAAPIRALEGQVLPQGRGEANHSGTEIALLQQGVGVEPVLITLPNGSFFFNDLATGDYQFIATHPGWLAVTRDIVIADPSQTVNTGTIKLLAGDADADNDVDSRDLKLFQRGLGQPPRQGTFTDINDDGIVDIVDTTCAGQNIGRTGN